MNRATKPFGVHYYRGSNGSPYERIGAGMIVGTSMLTARGIPASGEGDRKKAVAMKIMDTLGAGGSFTEFYAMDFDEDFLLMGHDGPGHIAISDRKPVLRRLGVYHGKAGRGVSTTPSGSRVPQRFCIRKPRTSLRRRPAAPGRPVCHLYWPAYDSTSARSG